MDAKQTLGIGLGVLLIGIIVTIIAKVQVWTVLLGGAALLALLVGLLFIGMGYVQVKEDRENLMREKAEAEKAAAMAASEA